MLTDGANLLKLLNWCGTTLVIKTLDVTNSEKSFFSSTKNLPAEKIMTFRNENQIDIPILPSYHIKQL